MSHCMNLYLASYLLCTGFKKMFRKLLKILNQQDPKFFLFVLLELWLVYHFPRFCSFSTLAHKVNEAWKWHKTEKIDLWPQFTSCANEGPSSLHLHLFLMHASKAILNLPTSSLHLCSPLQQKRKVKIHHQFTSFPKQLGQDSPPRK